MSRLKYIIANEFFITCQLLRANDFIKYCTERNISVSSEALEKFEKLGFFYPFVRVQYPKIKIKVEYVNDGKQYKYLGILKDGEKWLGDTKEKYAQFSFEKDYALSWFKDGYVWEPLTRSFQEWKTFRDDKGYRQIESFYSIFQCYELKSLLSLMRTKVAAENLLDNDSAIKSICDWAKREIEYCKKRTNKEGDLVYICQILSNRYYPQTQTDQRSVSITHSMLSHHDWDWNEYCRHWVAKIVLGQLKIDINEIEKLQKMIARTAEFIDPLRRWYELVSFVSVDKKKKLKGDALYAQTLYAMENMLRLFYKDLTGKELLPPDESSYFDKKKFYGEGIVEDELKYLEFIVNQYNLNPRPKLVLVVEGEGEERQFPRLAKELLNISFPVLSIEVVNLRGVGNFTGRKGIDKYGALEKFIDYYHSRQTIVFVILDNEGRVPSIKQKLVNTQSKFYPKRYVTKDDYIYVWNKNMEFDNFNTSELAEAMTNLSENRYNFTSKEVERCMHSFGVENNPLGRLFEEKCNYKLEKPKLLELLFSFVISNSNNEFDDKKNPKREIVRVLLRIIELASKNYQPATKEIWEKNQESGWFGGLIKT